MLMCFIGFGNTPPAPSAPDEQPSREQGGDDTGIEIPRNSASDHGRHRRKTSPIGRYAWAISLGIHALVLFGAFLAMRFYLRPLPLPKAAEVDTQMGTGAIIQGADASDLIHGPSAFTFVPADSASDLNPQNPGNLPASVKRDPQIAATLSNLSPVSGVMPFHQADSFNSAPFHLTRVGHSPGATQPSDREVR